jgi:oligopeptide transport system substrate-binding protein
LRQSVRHHGAAFRDGQPNGSGLAVDQIGWLKQNMPKEAAHRAVWVCHLLRLQHHKAPVQRRRTDERTVEITLKAPTPYFLQVLVMEQAMPVHQKTVLLGEDWAKPGKMVSNGAYMLEDWKPSSHIRLVKNPYYWNAAKVAIDAVEFDPTENLATVLKRYRAGEFDIVRRNLPTDRRVRQALAMAVNRELLVNKVLQAGDLPAYGFVPDGTANYVSQKASWVRMTQVERESAAVKLMTEAGYGARKPLNVRLEYGPSENAKRIAVAIAAMWKKLGVNVEHLVSEQKVHVANMRRGDFEVGGYGWRRLQRRAGLPLPLANVDQTRELREILQSGLRPAHG